MPFPIDSLACKWLCKWFNWLAAARLMSDILFRNYILANFAKAKMVLVPLVDLQNQKTNNCNLQPTTQFLQRETNVAAVKPYKHLVFVNKIISLGLVLVVVSGTKCVNYLLSTSKIRKPTMRKYAGMTLFCMLALN